jgi:hypothetical protein
MRTMGELAFEADHKKGIMTSRSFAVLAVSTYFVYIYILYTYTYVYIYGKGRSKISREDFRSEASNYLGKQKKKTSYKGRPCRGILQIKKIWGEDFERKGSTK